MFHHCTAVITLCLTCTAAHASVVIDMPAPPPTAAAVEADVRPGMVSSPVTTYEQAVVVNAPAASDIDAVTVGEIALQRFGANRYGKRNTYNLGTRRYARSYRGHGYGYYGGCGYGYYGYPYYYGFRFHRGFNGVGLGFRAPRGTVGDAAPRISHFRRMTPVRHFR